MRVLMMSNTYLPIVGGLEKSIVTFTEQFRKKGHKVKIIAPSFKGEKERDPNVIRLPSIQNFNKTDFSLHLPSPGILEDIFESYHPDVVHAHHPFLIGDLALRLCGQYEIPLVFTYHTMFEQYTDYFALDNKIVRDFVVRLAAGYANLTDHVIVPSQSILKILRERDVEAPISVVPTGFDVDKFKNGSGAAFRKKYDIPQDAFVVGHVGRLSEEKNLIFLAQTLACFLIERPGTFFFIVGGGSCEEKMKRIFDDAGVTKQVVFAGVLKDQALVDAYHVMDVFAFASLSETQGMVLTEAMSAGVPVVAVDAPGVREVVKTGENGELIPCLSQARMLQALGKCHSLPDSEFSLLCEGAEQKAAEFTADKCADKALKVYNKVLKEKRKQRKKMAKENSWKVLMKRLETEWSMFENLGNATQHALKKKVFNR